MNDYEPYDCGDMGLAVALVCCGFELISLERPQHGNRITFRFKVEGEIYQATQDYWSGNLMVDAKRYWNETKNLKTRLYSQS